MYTGRKSMGCFFQKLWVGGPCCCEKFHREFLFLCFVSFLLTSLEVSNFISLPYPPVDRNPNYIFADHRNGGIRGTIFLTLFYMSNKKFMLCNIYSQFGPKVESFPPYISQLEAQLKVCVSISTSFKVFIISSTTRIASCDRLDWEP